MNDRFKFRAYITSIISEGDDKEKEVGFYIENVAVYSDGGVGFDRDSLLNALYKLNLTESQRDEIEEYLSENGFSLHYEWFAVDLGIVEQCTGLKDRNGKLIYEGDIVREISKREPEYEEYITAVEWNNCGFNLYREDEYDFLIIGNIHENPELLEAEHD